MEFKSKIKTIEWVDNFSRMIDQTILPKEFKPSAGIIIGSKSANIAVE